MFAFPSRDAQGPRAARMKSWSLQPAGVIGSFNTLWGRIHGMIGFVIDGSRGFI